MKGLFKYGRLYVLGGGQAAGVPGIVVSLTLICVANDLLWSLPGGLLCLVPPLRHPVGKHERSIEC